MFRVLNMSNTMPIHYIYFVPLALDELNQP